MSAVQIAPSLLAADFTVYWQITGPEGDSIFGGFRGADTTTGVFTLEQGGQYTLMVSGYNAEAGSFGKPYPVEPSDQHGRSRWSGTGQAVWRLCPTIAATRSARRSSAKEAS